VLYPPAGPICPNNPRFIFPTVVEKLFANADKGALAIVTAAPPAAVPPAAADAPADPPLPPFASANKLFAVMLGSMDT
jgi:hypothetical protein